MPVRHFTGMNERAGITLLLGVFAVLLIVGLMFSARLTADISHAAYLEATQQSPVPTPPSLAPAKAAPAHT